MNATHRKTLSAIFTKPAKADVRWEAIEALSSRAAGTNMGRTEIVERIRARAEAVKALGATALYIYGSRGDGRHARLLNTLSLSIVKSRALGASRSSPLASVPSLNGSKSEPLTSQQRLPAPLSGIGLSSLNGWAD